MKIAIKKIERGKKSHVNELYNCLNFNHKKHKIDTVEKVRMTAIFLLLGRADELENQQASAGFQDLDL